MKTPRIEIKEEKVLSDNWYVLKRYTFDYFRKNGIVETQMREVYDRGNGATILLYNQESKRVILTRQFRIPTYVNGNTSGMLIEACAGLLDSDNPEVAIKRETEEETGFKITNVEKVFEAYMSPGSVSEILYFFIAAYTNETERSLGGGIEDEEIEVLEIPFTEAIDKIKTGEIKDGKTIMLLQHLQLTGLMG